MAPPVPSSSVLQPSLPAPSLPPPSLSPKHADTHQLRSIIAGVSDGVILIDPDQRIVWANQPALDMHGVADLAGLGGTATGYRDRFELRYRNRHRLPEGEYPLERVMA